MKMMIRADLPHVDMGSLMQSYLRDVVGCTLNIYITYKGYGRFLTGCNGIYMNWQ